MILKRARDGFTLVEILVAIGILVILFAVALVSLQGARRSARDSRRKADLEEIRSALEMYRTDLNTYPPNLPALEDNEYLGEVPEDPLYPARNYYYNPPFGTDTYILCAALENEDPAEPECGTNCGSGVDCNYAVYNP